MNSNLYDNSLSYIRHTYDVCMTVYYYISYINNNNKIKNKIINNFLGVDFRKW